MGISILYIYIIIIFSKKTKQKKNGFYGGKQPSQFPREEEGYSKFENKSKCPRIYYYYIYI